MSDEPAPKRCCARPPRRIPWCDGRFRCTICPKGMGRNGTGYARARNVPCTDPGAHLTVSDAENCDPQFAQFSDPNAVHFDLPVGRALNRDAGDVAKPGNDGWCIACDPHKLFQNGRMQATTYTIPLDAHVGTWPEGCNRSEAVQHLQPAAPAQRARTAQLPWCDGLYRCAYCLPAGQTRPLGAKQCRDPTAHMPAGARGQFVHFLPSCGTNALRTGDEALLEVSCMRYTGGCGRCAADGGAPSSPERRWPHW